MADTDMDIKLFRGIEGLELIREAWQDILSHMQESGFFHQWEWYHSYLKCLEPDPDAYEFYLFTREDVPAAVFPLHRTMMKKGGFRLRALSLPVHDHFLLCDLICRDDALRLPLLSLLGRYLKKQGTPWDVIVLRHILENACAMKIIQQDPPSRWLLREEGVSDYTVTNGTTYEVYETGLSKNARKSLKRARKNLQQLPDVSFSFAPAGPELEERFQAFLEVEASGWKGAGGTGTAIRLHEDLVCFYRDLVSSLSESGSVRINSLHAEGKCIAAQFCLQTGGTFYMLKIGYDEAYSHCAPGKVLVDELLRRCMQDPAVDAVNYVTDTAWHADWMPEKLKKSVCYIYNDSAAGLMAYATMKAYGDYIKPHLPEWLKERLRSLVA